MATPTLGSTPTTIDLAEAVTNWGGDTFSLEPDIKVQGSNSVACVQTVNGNNDAYVTGTWDFSGTGLGDQHLRLWFNITYIGDLAASNAIQIFLYDGTNTAYYYWDKWSDYTGGWAQAVIYTGDTPDSGTVTKSSVTRIGMRFVTQVKPRNVPANAWFDAWRYGDGYYATGGTSGDEITLETIAAADLVQAYGIVQNVNGVYFLRGDLQIGNGSTTTWFDCDGDIGVFVQEQVNTGLYKIHGNGSGCRVAIADAVFKSDGTAAKDAFDFDMSETNLLTCSVTGTQLVRADQVDFKASQVATANTFRDCGVITHGGADMDDSSVSGYEGTADTAALVYNETADPDGEVDNMSFTKGTASTHALELGLSSPTSVTLRGHSYSGYNAANAQTDSTILVSRTSGTVTINVIGGDTPTYKTAGASVDIVANPVAATVTCRDAADQALLQNARVILAASDGTGPYPFEESISMVRSATTVTVTHTGHGMADDDWVNIAGATEDGYNGCFQITVSDVDTYTYTTTKTPASPATGSPTATWALFNTLTSALGIVTDTRTYSSNQPVEGWARKSTSSPYYKSSNLTGVIDKDSGLLLTAQMVSDE